MTPYVRCLKTFTSHSRPQSIISVSENQCRLISVLDYCGECESEMSNVFAEYIESKIISRIESLTKIVEDHFIDLGYGKKDEFLVTFVVK